MPTFTYSAIDDFGHTVEGTASAGSEAALAQTLRAQGRYLVNATAAGAGFNLADIRLFERVNRRDLIFFSSQLATMLTTGVPILDGLLEIESQAEKVALRRIVAVVRRDIENGLSFSAALARHPQAFNELYVNIVRAGEATGKLDKVLEELVVQLEWQEELGNRIREVSTYPIIVSVMLTVLATVLVTFTIPRFVQVYQRLATQIELPLPTRIVMGVSVFFRDNWYIVAMAGLVAYIAIAMYGQTPDGAARIQGFILRLPVVGELIRRIALSRFARYFGTLHEAGLEVTPSLSLVERLIGNAYLAQRFRQAVDRVMVGESLSRALQQVGEFPNIVIQMIAVGERTGQMSKSLRDVQLYFDREVDRAVKRILTLSGPIMLMILAGLFALIALAFYLPLFRLLRVVR